MTHQKVVIITGAGSGMGYAVTRKFARDGFKVVLNGRTESKLNKTAGEMDVENSLVVCGDVSQPKDVAHVIAFLASEVARFVTGAIIPIDGGLSASNGQYKL